MPKIVITQDEDVSLSSVVNGQVSVLIPLYLKNDSEEEDLKVKSFTSDSAFKTAYETKVFPLDIRSYYMARSLLLKGIKVFIKQIKVPDDWTAETPESVLAEYLSQAINNGKLYDEFASRNLFDLYFITTGAHSNLFFGKPQSESSYKITGGCYDKIGSIAKERGDCVALVELEGDFKTDLSSKDGDKRLVDLLSAYKPDKENGAYSACFYPWGEYSIIGKTLDMPGCFGYLSALATSIQSNASWLSAAGTSRGYIPGLNSLHNAISDKLAEYMQGDSSIPGTTAVTPECMINPIRYISGIGDRIWGNKVVKKFDETSYLNFLNVRILTSEIKKQVYLAALKCTFEPNDNITWGNFKSLSNNLLDRMVSGRGIEWYSWKRKKCEKKATIKANLTIKPIESVEYFEINITLTDAESSAEEVI